LIIVGHHLACIHSRIGSRKPLDRKASSFQGLVDNLEKETALWIQAHGLGGIHAEEGGVETAMNPLSLEEVCLLDVGMAMVLAALVIEAIHNEAIRRDGLGHLAWVANKVPKLRGRRCIARESAGSSNNGDGFLGSGSHST
jgi:hypothetical protein